MLILHNQKLYRKFYTPWQRDSPLFPRFFPLCGILIRKGSNKKIKVLFSFLKRGLERAGKEHVTQKEPRMSNLCYLICLRHLIRSRADKNRIFFAPIRPIFLHACATCSELPSNISSMEVILFYEMKSIIFYTIQISCYSSERKKRKHGKIFTQ